MSRSLRVVAFGLAIAAVVLIFGSADGTRAAQAQGTLGGSSATQPIYPAGGSDGPS